VASCLIRVRPLVATPHACACPFAVVSRPRTHPLVVACLVCPYTCLLGVACLLCSCACPLGMAHLVYPCARPLGMAPHVCAQSPWVPTPRALWQRLFQPCLLARCWKFPWPGLVQCPQPALFDYAHAAVLPLGWVCQCPGVDFPRICVRVHSHALVCACQCSRGQVPLHPCPHWQCGGSISRASDFGVDTVDPTHST